MKKQWIRAATAGGLLLSLASTGAQAQLLANGGFEAGLTSWSTAGFQLEGYDFGVGDIAHTGTQGFYGGGIQTAGYLFQTMPTVPGQDYMLSFWLFSDGFLPNELTLLVGGVTLYTAGDVLLQGFQEVRVDFRASSAATELRFGLRNDSGFLRLDDINVSAVPEPTPAVLLGLGVAVLAALRRRA